MIMDRKKAVEILKGHGIQIYPDRCDDPSLRELNEALLFLVPELGEEEKSEDDKIRDYLINGIKGRHDCWFPTPEGLTREKILDWLGRRKDVSRKEFEEEFYRKAKAYDIDLPMRGYDIHAMCDELYDLLAGPKGMKKG